MSDIITIRLMTEEDIDRILVVEHNAFPTPWSRTAFYNELMNNQFAHYLLIEVNSEVVGYCGVWVIIDEAHITNIAIHSEYRGKKLGETLLVHAMELAKTFGAKKMTLEVRVSNHVAQELYKKLGFEACGVRKNYYTDNLEDALIMWVNLNEQTEQ